MFLFRSVNMDSSAETKRVQVPNALREVLLEFSIAYLLEKPNDVIDFAVDYFSKIQQHRPIKEADVHVGDDISVQESEPSEDEGKFLYQKLISDEKKIIFYVTSLH